MRKAAQVCCLLLVFAVRAPAVVTSADLTKAEALRTAKNWAALALASDVVGLDTLLEERYVHTHGTGLIESKKEFLAALGEGGRDYVRCKPREMNAQLLGRAAIVAGTLDFKVVARGRKIEGTNRFMMILERTPNGVRVVAYQATSLTRRR